MSHPRKFFFHNTAVFITTRTVEGLPFTCASYIKAILRSVLARAQHLYPVRIFSFIFLANHLHLGLVVTDPELVPKFMKYVKGESAAAINRLLGRSARRVWEEGYDSPVILDAQKAMQQIVYTYVNPAKAHLVDAIEHYPGLSSWEHFGKQQVEERCPWIRKKRIPKLTKKVLTRSEQEEFTSALLENSQVAFTLHIEPNCWMECYPELQGRSPEEINAEIRKGIKASEATLRAERTKPVVGAKKLIFQRINLPYLPSKRGRRMWCLSSDPALRKDYIARLKCFLLQAELTYQSWKQGDLSAPFPLGLFPPAGRYRGNLIAIDSI